MRFQIALSAEDLNDTVSEKLDGVGLIRGEYILRKAGIYSTHPDAPRLIEMYVNKICSLFYPKPVWYRFAELEVSEANALAGIDKVLPRERNPVVGLRGIRRARLYPDGFQSELEALRTPLSTYSNLGVLLPFTSDPSDLTFAAAESDRLGLSPPFGIMAEIPSAILRLDDYITLGLKCVLVGMNDLTGLTLGIERATDEQAFGHKALLDLLAIAREKTARAGIPLSVAGYLPKYFLPLAAQHDVDYAVLHYSRLNTYFPEIQLDAHESGGLERIKSKTMRMIEEFEQSGAA